MICRDCSVPLDAPMDHCFCRACAESIARRYDPAVFRTPSPWRYEIPEVIPDMLMVFGEMLLTPRRLSFLTVASSLFPSLDAGWHGLGGAEKAVL